MSGSAALPGQDVDAGGGGTWRRQRPAWLYAGLLDGSHTTAGQGGPEEWPVELHSLGSIELPAGQLVACDPYVADSHEPAFTATLPAGRHDVVIARATVGPAHVRNTAAVLVAGVDPISRWDMALTGEADESALDDDWGYFGYGVDAGTGCFASPEGQATATAVLAADGGMLEDPLSTALMGSPIRAVVAEPARGSPAVAVFETGWGDGYYPTWIGRSRSGAVVVAVTDFLVPTDPFGPDEPAPSPAPPTAAPGVLGRLLRRRR